MLLRLRLELPIREESTQPIWEYQRRIVLAKILGDGVTAWNFQDTYVLKEKPPGFKCSIFGND